MRCRIGLWTLLLLAVAASGHPDSSSIQLTKENFQSEVDGDNVFVMFYAPWCDYCKKLAPTWAQLAETRHGESFGAVKIGRVDCTTDGELCTQQEVSGYPTLKLFKKGSFVSDGALVGIKYRGARDLEQFNAFLNEQLGSGSNGLLTDAVVDDHGDGGVGGSEAEDGEELPPPPPTPDTPLVELTEDTFAKHISTGKHFVKFYAPWCGHCTKLAPTWEELANTFEHERDIRVSKIDCTRFRPICTDFEVKGYPTLLWIEDGKKIEKYTGPRTHDDLKRYVTQMAGAAGLQDGAADHTAASVEGAPDKDNTSVVVQLSERDFANAIAKGVTAVKFYAPWCGHCMRLAPTWEQLAEKFAARDGVRIAKVDCTVDGNKELCGEQEVNGYPTVFLYRDGEKITEYYGHRSLEDLHAFVVQHLTGQHDEL
ncbi:thioredoxin domain-containing protein 5 homolog [Anopheles cruzii]|uniref:thioredoxin domain-containing protein 5 homolog n=1 Tax=Anopheles cruzii TaxID=68878 RepID=UPI0022EC7F05|nr:thioredoxin domain-containing protein 5 homolog [Anopheles cruzii]